MTKARRSRFLSFVALCALVAGLLALITGTATGQIPGLPGYGTTTTAGQGGQNAQQGNQNAQQGGQNAQQGNQNAQQGGQNAQQGTQTGQQGGQSAQQGSQSAQQGGQSAQQGSQSAQQGGQSAQQGTTQQGGQNAQQGSATTAAAGAATTAAGGAANAATTPAPCQSSKDMGTVTVGAQLNVTCSFAPNAPITLIFNGVSAGLKNADSAGNAVFRVTVFAIDRIDVDDIVPGVCGRNVLTGTGQGTGGLSSAELLFNLDCGASSLAGSSASGGNLVRGGTIVLPSGQVPLGLISATGPAPGAVLPAPAGATTGAAVLGGSARNGRSSTAFTGANVVRLTLIGLACIALGWQLTRLRRRGILS